MIQKLWLQFNRARSSIRLVVVLVIADKAIERKPIVKGVFNFNDR